MEDAGARLFGGGRRPVLVLRPQAGPLSTSPISPDLPPVAPYSSYALKQVMRGDGASADASRTDVARAAARVRALAAAAAPSPLPLPPLLAFPLAELLRLSRLRAATTPAALRAELPPPLAPGGRKPPSGQRLGAPLIWP